MKIIRKIAELRTEIARLRREGKRIALVPTMGYFHAGHLSLMKVASEKADVLVVSLFVNPTQFAPSEDLDQYPRDFDRDERLAREHGTNILFYPEVAEMYPDKQYTYIITEELAGILCGKYRPTHFRGVTTIVAKLFNIVLPDLAVFGQKDHQQAIIIRRMVEDLNFPVEIVVAPIVREADGLAMSSRNVYLSTAERRDAPRIQQALQGARTAVEAGERSADKIRTLIRTAIEQSDLAKLQYIEIVNDRDLASQERIEAGTFAAVAVYYGKTRLIDNIYLMP